MIFFALDSSVFFVNKFGLIFFGLILLGFFGFFCDFGLFWTMFDYFCSEFLIEQMINNRIKATQNKQLETEEEKI
jgi:hypothetical protein